MRPRTVTKSTKIHLGTSIHQPFACATKIGVKLDFFNIGKVGSLTATAIAETSTYRVWLEEAGFEVNLFAFDFGPNEELRYSFAAHIADRNLADQIGGPALRSLCYGNSSDNQEVAWATLHWDGLREVLQIMKERDM